MSIGKLPNFLIVGAQKCGTTTLHDLLDLHPLIGMSNKKEINYFTQEKNYSKGLAWYESHFSRDPQYQILGESSPGYLCSHKAAERIKLDLSDVKILITVREPIARALSQYWDNRRQLNETDDFSTVIRKYLAPEYNESQRGYFSRGVYSPQVRKYMELFGENNVHVIVFEEWIKDPRSALNTVCEFLGVSIFDAGTNLDIVRNASLISTNAVYRFFFSHPEFTKFLPRRGKKVLSIGSKKPFKYSKKLDESDRKILMEFYRPYNEDLRILLRRENPIWEYEKE